MCGLWILPLRTWHRVRSLNFMTDMIDDIFLPSITTCWEKLVLGTVEDSKSGYLSRA